jgi:sugar/nucleoside kinase (ribokinase family)
VTEPQQHVVVVGESLVDELRSAQETVERVGGSDAFMAGFLQTWLQHRDVAGALTRCALVARY